ncbi:MAG: hypothetical protein COY42_02230 [Armatimonadetes bacterium CG_4_10_14_0_8_um_filter_66_14]|nr:MAG: hypothetical protein COY42_02230 [Armatimonadetes bacterium CG_4_10_14_0_8_um_filter_66_14]
MAQDRDHELGSQALAGALQSSFRLLQLAMVAILVYIVFTGVYVVKQHEVALVLRLGKVVGTKADRVRQPGLHFGFPYPLDEVIRVSVKNFQTVKSETHWYQLNDAEKEAVARKEDPGPGPPTLRPLMDGYTVTGDTNILHSQWQLTYQIVDPVRYALDFAQNGKQKAVEELLRAALDNAVVIVSARYAADAAYRTERNQFTDDVVAEVSRIITAQNLGCSVERLDPVIEPPRQVKMAFEIVFAAEQEGDRLRKEAEGYAKRVVLESEGKASQIKGEAQGLAGGTVQRARADAEAFLKLLPQYKQNSAVIRKTTWLGTLNRVLANADEKMLVHDEEELRLQLSRDPKVIAEQSRKAVEGEAEAKPEGAPQQQPAGPPPGADDGHGH